ncbi:MAG: hemerythrin domain-containing protein [Candidatus Hodarchaeales archaeon]|jgi:hypothetical protein
MTLIKDLQIEHEEILALFQNIESDLKDLEKNENKIDLLSENLKEIKDRVLNHLFIEEEKLYPILLDKERSDGIIDKEADDNQTLLIDFLSEQKEIGNDFIQYNMQNGKISNGIIRSFLLKQKKSFKEFDPELNQRNKNYFRYFRQIISFFRKFLGQQV